MTLVIVPGAATMRAVERRAVGARPLAATRLGVTPTRWRGRAGQLDVRRRRAAPGEMHAPIRRGTAHWGPVRGTVDTSTVKAGGKPVERAQPDNAAAASEE